MYVCIVRAIWHRHFLGNFAKKYQHSFLSIKTKQLFEIIKSQFLDVNYRMRILTEESVQSS